MYAKLIGLLFVVGLMSGAYFYVVSLQNKNIELEKANTAQTIVIEQNKVALENIQSALVDASQRMGELNNAFEKSRLSITNLETKLAKHDLETLAIRKPGLITKRINAATKRLFRDIETFTANNEQAGNIDTEATEP